MIKLVQFHCKTGSQYQANRLGSSEAGGSYLSRIFCSSWVRKDLTLGGLNSGCLALNSTTFSSYSRNSLMALRIHLAFFFTWRKDVKTHLVIPAYLHIPPVLPGPLQQDPPLHPSLRCRLQLLEAQMSLMNDGLIDGVCWNCRLNFSVLCLDHNPIKQILDISYI